jgi:hypothetical protein
MILKDIYYYLIAFAMMAGVLIAYVLNLDIDQGSNGRISVSFGSSNLFIKLHQKIKSRLLQTKLRNS